MKIKGLKQACSNTKGIKSPTEWAEIFYNLSENKVWVVYHNSINVEWTEYKDSDTIRLCITTKPLTQKEIARLVKHYVIDKIYTNNGDKLTLTEEAAALIESKVALLLNDNEKDVHVTREVIGIQKDRVLTLKIQAKEQQLLAHISLFINDHELDVNIHGIKY